MDDIDQAWNALKKQRPNSLWGKFPGSYRAEVVETNDPLQIHRVRVKVPELHDWNLKPEECPWAVCAFQGGGRRAKEWRHPCIGDWVWVVCEKEHPYNLIWTGFADPTRRKLYSLPSISGKTPLAVDKDGEPADMPDDYNEEYLPKDSRPMNQGIQDRYGNLDVLNSVGFFPKEHEKKPAPNGVDAIQQKDFETAKETPKVNEPDTKYMARITKYGHLFILGDQGYWWKKDGGSASSNFGEFEGDHEKDEEFEIKRWKYLQKLINEDEPKETDQRRIAFQTRYGHKFELRDVGWAQNGPIVSRTRDGEYGDPTILSKEDEKDFRWIKLRTKAGMLFQLYDKGADPAEDEFIKRPLLEEVADKTEKENEFWKDKDARQIRLITRHGFKIVMDDRGSDKKDAETKETPRGNGILIKGRRTAAAGGEVKEGDERGFYWEFNENEDTNQTTWGTPGGMVMQMSDRMQYLMLATRKPEYTRPYQKHKENEFLLEPYVMEDAEKNTHHLKIDHANEYIRLKTRARQGTKPLGDQVNEPKLSGTENQGLEIRDGSQEDDPWVELVDADQRGLWFWGQGKYVICRASQAPDEIKLYWWFDENKKQVVIKHNENAGKLQICCNQDVEIIANRRMNLYSKQQMTLRSDERIVLTGGGTNVEVGPGGLGCSATYKGPMVESYICGVMPGPGAGCPKAPNITPDPAPAIVPTPDKIQPTNRGKRYNMDLEKAADIKEIEHPKLG